MDMEHLEKLMTLMRSQGVVELELGQGETHTRIRLAEMPQIAPVSSTMMMPMAAQNMSSETAQVDEQLHHVKSPFVGTFYIAPSPGVKAYVSVGDRVHKGQVLCIVEAMKLMNEILADCDGVVRKSFVENEDPVEFEQPLFGIEKS